MKYIALFAFVMLPACCFSQNVKTATIRWNSQRTFDIFSGESKDEVTSITNTAASNLVWKNADGSARKTFQVVETRGEWPNTSVDGKVQFEVTDGQVGGTISIQRRNNETKVLIVMATEPPSLHELTIQSFQQQ
jgi:hypothetical protein